MIFLGKLDLEEVEGLIYVGEIECWCVFLLGKVVFGILGCFD